MDCCELPTQGGPLRFENEAYQLLRSSTSAEEIEFVTFFPFQNPSVAQGIICSRIIQKNLGTAGRLNENDYLYEALSKLASNAPFVALITNACSIEAMAAEDILVNLIRDLFSHHNLPLMSLLERLKVLNVLYQEILDGFDPKWNVLLEEIFSFLDVLRSHTPWQLAKLLMEKELCFQRLCPNHFLDPAELRSNFPQWSMLIEIVRVCAKAHPVLVGDLKEAAYVG